MQGEGDMNPTCTPDRLLFQHRSNTDLTMGPLADENINPILMCAQSAAQLKEEPVETAINALSS